VIKTNKPIGVRVSDVGAGGKEYNVKTDKAYDDAQAKKKLPQGADFAAQRRKERLASNGRMDEEQHSVLYKMKKDDEKIAVAHYKSKDDAHKFLSSVKTKGGNGIVRTKTNEEVEQVDELSSDLLGRYKTGASKQASELDKAGNIKKADSRFRGIVKATKKQFNNDLKKEEVKETKIQESGGDVVFKKGDDHIEKYGEDSFALYKNGKKMKFYTSIEAAKEAMNEEFELQEGRPSQRHPLEGHDYHKKTNAELEYIAKDAHKAADAMKSHNTDAENKYRDQANDSATVRYFRQKNGMPDWYKKKYGHVKESVEVLDGEEMQASEIIDNIQESRKKAIVREALKDAKDRMEKKGKKEEKKDAMGGKGDKFEAEPQMTSLVNDKQ
jgi:hypothetical protein